MSMKTAQPFSDVINEHDTNEILKKKNVSALFALYEDDDNIKEVSKAFAQSNDPKELIREIKDEGIEQKNLPIAKKARRDEELINGVTTSLTKTETNAQWLKYGIAFAAGIGSLAVSLALCYLFQKKPDFQSHNTLENEQVAELIRNINHLLTAAPTGKNGCS